MGTTPGSSITHAIPIATLSLKTGASGSKRFGTSLRARSWRMTMPSSWRSAIRPKRSADIRVRAAQRCVAGRCSPGSDLLLLRAQVVKRYCPQRAAEGRTVAGLFVHRALDHPGTLHVGVEHVF